MTTRTKLLIGADPELFVQSGDVFVSGHTWPVGTKKEPKKLQTCWAQNDGLALEFNIEPAETKAKFIYRIVSGIKEVSAVIPQTAKLHAHPTVYFGREYLKSLPQEVSALGCNPDMNAWTLKTNKIPDADLPIRTGSGHIHLGWTKDEDVTSEDHVYMCAMVVRELDYFLGLMSLSWDSDNQRRQLYGKAGAFRPKPYGVEYRTLSNAWLKSTYLMGVVFTQAQKAYRSALDGGKIASAYKDVARQYIDGHAFDWQVRNPVLATEIGV